MVTADPTVAPVALRIPITLAPSCEVSNLLPALAPPKDIVDTPATSKVAISNAALTLPNLISLNALILRSPVPISSI